MDIKEFLREEKERILEWLEQYEEEMEETITLKSFKWKDHVIEWRGDFKYVVDNEKETESWEEALDYVEELEIKRINS